MVLELLYLCSPTIGSLKLFQPSDTCSIVVFFIMPVGTQYRLSPVFLRGKKGSKFNADWLYFNYGQTSFQLKQIILLDMPSESDD